MNTVKSFSGTVNAPKSTSKFDFVPVSDGKIYQATRGTDYVAPKGFLVALTRYANKNGFTVNRYAAPDGSTVEFQLTANPS